MPEEAGPATHRPSEYARMLREASRHADAYDRSKLYPRPLSGLAILACMDARLQLEEILGLRAGDVHMIRNAGGLATDDAIRSLVVSERMLGVREVVVIEHTHCGMMTFDDEAMRKKLSHQTGHATDIHFGTFTDLRANLLAQVDKIKSHVWLKHLPVHGLIYHVEDGRLEEVV